MPITESEISVFCTSAESTSLGKSSPAKYCADSCCTDIDLQGCVTWIWLFKNNSNHMIHMQLSSSERAQPDFCRTGDAVFFGCRNHIRAFGQPWNAGSDAPAMFFLDEVCGNIFLIFTCCLFLHQLFIGLTLISSTTRDRMSESRLTIYTYYINDVLPRRFLACLAAAVTGQRCFPPCCPPCKPTRLGIQVSPFFAQEGLPFSTWWAHCRDQLRPTYLLSSCSFKTVKSTKAQSANHKVSQIIALATRSRVSF